MSDEPEPSGWELLRGLKEVKESLDGIKSGMVTQGQHEALITRVSAIETDQREQRKTKAQQWFAIGICVLGMVGTVVTSLVIASINGGST